MNLKIPMLIFNHLHNLRFRGSKREISLRGILSPALFSNPDCVGKGSGEIARREREESTRFKVGCFISSEINPLFFAPANQSFRRLLPKSRESAGGPGHRRKWPGGDARG